MNEMHQISTLQALVLGYSRGVVSVEELLEHGDLGLGTFEDIAGEMIVVDRKAYQANNLGEIHEMGPEKRVPFGAVAFMEDAVETMLDPGCGIESLKRQLNVLVDSDFGLNSMYAIRLDGFFPKVHARSLAGQHSEHVELSEILKKNQKEFLFENIAGTIVGLRFPDYMEGINAAGWHFHFISADRTCGGHVFDLDFERMPLKRCRLHNIRIQLPTDAAFDTYELKSVSKDDVKKVEG